MSALVLIFMAGKGSINQLVPTFEPNHMEIGLIIILFSNKIKFPSKIEAAVCHMHQPHTLLVSVPNQIVR